MTNTLLSEIGYKYLRMEQISQLLSGEYYDKEEFLSGQKNMIENATKALVDWETPRLPILTQNNFQDSKQNLKEKDK